MNEDQTLAQELTTLIKYRTILISTDKVEPHIKDNLNPQFPIRPYQAEAFSRFAYYTERYPDRIKPTQLLFHMATGSGKTLIMAGCILDLYEQGYRHFICFVNSSNVIEKTRDNFLNSRSSKYLFNDTISIADKKIAIRAVDNFETANRGDINMVFTTIQGLHARLNTPRENSLTYEDFEDKKIVLISDEAHHINAETKKSAKTKGEEERILSWECTVNKIFKAHSGNYLLEFTATVDLSNREIEQKYRDKLLFDYPLKQFRIDKYSKEVQVLQADLRPFERALQAVILNQYRRKVFEAHGLHIKPVILFKSKTIKASRDFFGEFVSRIQSLTPPTVDGIKNRSGNPLLQKVFRYFGRKGITTAALIAELKVDFSRDKCIAVDSKNDSEEKQLAVNSLEDENNAYRAVFAVDKLNEGWDVLNLFDIVRLYDTRDSRAGKIGKTTMSEAQLIGRGARYCPFQVSPEQPLYQRKYDEDLERDLRICEALYYHSAHNPNYISELKKALAKIGIKASRTVQRRLELKDRFKQTSFYKSGVIYVNEKKGCDRSGIYKLDASIKNKIYKKKFPTGYVSISRAFDYAPQGNIKNTAQIHKLGRFGRPILRKAIDALPFYRFDNLQGYFPHLSSITAFITSAEFLKDIQVEMEGAAAQVQNPDNEMKLAAAISALDEISKLVRRGVVEFEGTRRFKPQGISYTFTDKTMNIVVDEDADREYGMPQSEPTNPDLFIDLSQKDWYAYNDNYGTDQEKYLVRYIEQAYNALRDEYAEIYLIRNEKHFKLYAFDDGRAVEPDFVLFLKDKNRDKSATYQLFIEAKGEHLVANDRWKENFLKQIETKYKLHTVFEGKDFKLIGMPFYNEEDKKEFKYKLYKVLNY